jgi:nitrilase
MSAGAPAESLSAALIQMVSGVEVQANLDRAAHWVAQAAGQGARLVVFPEYFCLLGAKDTDKLGIAESLGQGPIQQRLAALAREHAVWIAAGTVPLRTQTRTRVRNSLLVFSPTGQLQARYDKVHLFGFRKAGERFDEAATIEPGESPVLVDIEGWRLGLSICYDLRFPELYRRLGQCDALLVPSAFTPTTGQAHWDVLLRARAIENQCYVLAPAQGGRHANGRQTHGNTLAIDPWGNVLARVETGEGMALVTLERKRITEVRQMLPALEHRRMG